MANKKGIIKENFKTTKIFLAKFCSVNMSKGRFIAPVIIGLKNLQVYSNYDK